MGVRILLLTLASGAWAFNADFSGEEWKTRPVAKVINLLKDMQAQLQKEADQDQEVYDKMVCWCETNDKAKTKSIADGNQATAELTASIDEYTAKNAQLKSDIESLAQELAASEDALAKATAIRTKEAAEFHDEEKNSLTSISGLKNAVVVMSKQHSLSQEAMVQVQQAIKRHYGKESEKEMARLGLGRGAFLQQGAGQSYDPASGEIFGVLKGMKESFESNLKSSQDEEAQAKSAYSQLKTAKTSELAAARKQSENKEADLADTGEKLANARTDLKETTAQVEADTAFLADLKERCANMDAERAARMQVRNEEITAVGEALGILTSDDAQDALTKTAASFVQVAASSRAKKSRDRAARLIQDAAQKNGNPQLAALAVMMKSEVFTKIKESIDVMTVQLAEEGKDEIKHKDFCVEELNQNERQTAEKYDFRSSTQVKIEDLSSQIEKLTDEIAAAKAEVSETQIALKKASENRESQNKNFQLAISDQRATQEILTKALVRLQAFYAQKGALIQKNAAAKAMKSGQAPPPGFGGDYQKSSGSSGVMAMIQEIINESKAVESDAIKDEQDSQAAYESFVKDSNKSITALTQKITTANESKAKADEDKAAAEADLKATLDTLEELASYAGEVHRSCDFTLKNFDARQEARNAEIDALKQAKAILSGADLGM